MPALRARRAAALGLELLEPRLALAANFVISEFLADNNGSIIDNYGVESDWIEIHNSGDAAGNLAGYYLTDNAGELTKWQFPQANVPAGGYLRVWASGQDDRTPGQQLHTNFALAKEGEYLALVAPDGVTVLDDFGSQFPEQRTNISYGKGQVVDAVTYVAPGAAAQTIVPADGADDAVWKSPAFVPDGDWISGATGVGFGQTVPGFQVRTYRANVSPVSPIGVSVDTMTEALEVIGNPAAYTSVAGGNYSTVNFANTGVGGRYDGSVAYPGLDLTTDFNHIVTEVHAIVTIPTAGTWSFGVSSNEGFLLQVGDFELQRPATGNAEQVGMFTFETPGDYDLHLYNFERTGSTWLELYASPGFQPVWNPATFDLVGNVAAGGLAVKSSAVGSSGGGILSLLGTNLQTALAGVSSSFYTRIPFTADRGGTAFDKLGLRMKYDDAFVAYLNGVEVARRNFAGAPVWNSHADGGRTGDEVLKYEDIDISTFLSSLVAGNNVLAVHGMNVSAGDADALIMPELVATDFSPPGDVYFASPTPGAANGPGVAGFVADLQFSAQRGFYDAPFQLTITSATPGASIYYTTNGDEPTQGGGQLYTGPIPVSGTTTVRAAAYRGGYLQTDATTQTYLFLDDVVRQNQAATLARGLPASWGSVTPDYGMDPDVIGNFDAAGNPIGGDRYGGVYAATIKDDLKAIPTLSIVMDAGDMFGPSGIYSNSTQRGSAWERPTSVEWITADDSLQFQVNAGIRIQGGAFRSDGLTKKHSLRLVFRNQYGPGKLEYPIFGDGDDVADEFNTIVLRAGANDGYAWDAARLTEQYVRDEFGRSLQRAAGAPSPHGTFVHLYINGVYWGLYNPVERPDNEFGASYISGEADNWDSIHVEETPSGDDAAWDAMFAKAAQAGTSLAAYMELQGKNPDGTRNPAIAPLLDVGNYIDYITIGVWGGNWDWPWKNFWAGRDRDGSTTTGFQFFNWDFENTMGNNRDRSPLNATTLDQSFSGPRNAGQPHTSLRNNAEYRLAFADHVHKLFFNGGILTTQNLQARYAAIAAEVERAMVGESARWGDMHHSTPLTLTNWRTERDWILNQYLPQRSAIVMQELTANGLYPTVAAPIFSKHGGQVTAGFDLTMLAAAGTIWYTLDGSDPRLIGGAISPTALQYTGAVDIPQGLTVRARTLVGDVWSALDEATFTTAATANATNLRIVEVHYNPAPQSGVTDEQDLEFLELLNPSGQPVSLDGVQITQFISEPYKFPSGITLGPGERLIVARSPSAFEAAYGDGFNVAPAGYGDANLANSGERVALVAPDGQILQDFTYDDSGGWPAAADGAGKSLELIDPLADPTKPANWRASHYRGGSPGIAGTAPAFAGDFDADGDVDGNDFLAWQRGLGTPALQGTAMMGDADGDRDVDGSDFGLWRQNYGSGTAATNTAQIADAEVRPSDIVAVAVLGDDEWILTEGVAPRRRVGRAHAVALIVDEAHATFNSWLQRDELILSKGSAAHFRRSRADAFAEPADAAFENQNWLGLSSFNADHALATEIAQTAVVI